MTVEQLDQLFISIGYLKVISNLPEFSFYFRQENYGVSVVYLIDYSEDLYLSQDQYFHFKDKIKQFFHEQGVMETHILSLILCNDPLKAEKLACEDSLCWIFDKKQEKLMVPDGKVSDFYGLRKLIDEHLQDYFIGGEGEAASFSTLPSNKQEQREKTGGLFALQLSWVNIMIVAINVITFIICTFTGNLLYNKGALSLQYILQEWSVYRIITSMFLHVDIYHLFSNMIILYYVGEIVERRIGHVLYAIVYIMSGVGGAFGSLIYEMVIGEYTATVGASGAVFGTEAALLVLVIINHGKLEQMTTGRLIFAIVFSLYCGFTSTNVNNAAHLGGVLAGFLISLIVSLLMLRNREEK